MSRCLNVVDRSGASGRLRRVDARQGQDEQLIGLDFGLEIVVRHHHEGGPTIGQDRSERESLEIVGVDPKVGEIHHEALVDGIHLRRYRGDAGEIVPGL